MEEGDCLVREKSPGTDAGVGVDVEVVDVVEGGGEVEGRVVGEGVEGFGYLRESDRAVHVDESIGQDHQRNRMD